MKLLKKQAIIIFIILLIPIGLFSKGFITASKIKNGINLGNKNLSEGKYAEAIFEFNKVIVIDSENIPANLGLANTYIKAEKLSEAEKFLKALIKIDNKLSSPYLLLSDVYQSEDKLDEASSLLTEGNKLVDLSLKNSSITTLQVSKRVYDLASKQMTAKDYLSAISNFTKVIEQDSVRYKDSKEKIDECKKLDKKDTLAIATNALKNNKLDEAATIEKGVVKVDPINLESLKLKDDIAVDMQKQPIIYKNTKYKFQLEIPSSWRGKYTIDESRGNNINENAVAFNYMVDGKVATILLKIVVDTKGNPKEYFEDSEINYITTVHGNTFLWFQSGDTGPIS